MELKVILAHVIGAMIGGSLGALVVLFIKWFVRKEFE